MALYLVNRKGMWALMNSNTFQRHTTFDNRLYLLGLRNLTLAFSSFEAFGADSTSSLAAIYKNTPYPPVIPLFRCIVDDAEDIVGRRPGRIHRRYVILICRELPNINR